jgi:hypothetical protein
MVHFNLLGTDSECVIINTGQYIRGQTWIQNNQHTRSSHFLVAVINKYEAMLDWWLQGKKLATLSATDSTGIQRQPLMEMPNELQQSLVPQSMVKHWICICKTTVAPVLFVWSHSQFFHDTPDGTVHNVHGGQCAVPLCVVLTVYTQGIKSSVATGNDNSKQKSNFSEIFSVFVIREWYHIIPLLIETVTKILYFCCEWALLVTLKNVTTFRHYRSFKIYFTHTILHDKLQWFLSAYLDSIPR